MEKLCIDDIRFERLIVESEHSGVFSKPIGCVMKLLCPEYIDFLSERGLSLEDKVLNSSSIDLYPEIVVPGSAVYDGRNNFMGYIMPMTDGETYFNYNRCRKDLLSYACDLGLYASEFSRLESIVKRSDSVVFADLLDSSNIIYDGKNYKFVDYDGLQVNGFLSDSFFDICDKYKGSKYIYGNYFTKEYDIRNLISLYLECVFDYKLSRIDCVSSSDRASFIDREFSSFGLDFDDFKDLVYKLYQDGPNSYLADIVYSIASSYNMFVDSDGKRYVKKI